MAKSIRFQSRRKARRASPAKRARRLRKLVRRARQAEVSPATGLTALLDYAKTFGVVDWFCGLVEERAHQAVFHKRGCFLALLTRAIVGIGGMGDLVTYLCAERLAGRLGFERELTFVNPLADLMRDFTVRIVNAVLQRVVQTLVAAGVEFSRLLAIDSSFLHVFGKTYKRAARGYSGHLGKTALGYKLHVAYDVVLLLPLAIWITPGDVSDRDALKVLRKLVESALGPGPKSTYILDRGYFYAKQLAALGKGALFVCRAKMWPKYITNAVAALQDRDFTFRTAKYRIAAAMVTEPTQKLQLRMVVVRHVSFPKPMVLVTNNLNLSPPKVYGLYRKRFQIEFLFLELRGKWHLNRFVGTRYSQVVAHIGMAVIGLTVHRCFRGGLQRRTARAGIKILRRVVYKALIPNVPKNITSRQLSRMPLHRLTRELVKFLHLQATRLKSVLIGLLEASFPKPRILTASH